MVNRYFLSPLKSGKMYLIDERMCGFVSEVELDEQKGEGFHVAQVGLNLICSQGWPWFPGRIIGMRCHVRPVV